MDIVNTCTNASAGGLTLPYGYGHLALGGQVWVVPDNGIGTNLYMGSSDTLVVWSSGAGVVSGLGVWDGVFVGILLTVGMLGLVALVRRIARQLSGFTGFKEV